VKEKGTEEISNSLTRSLLIELDVGVHAREPAAKADDFEQRLAGRFSFRPFELVV
jgi:hypothetical protein